MALLQQRWLNMITMGQKNLKKIAEKARKIRDVFINKMHHKLYKHTVPLLIKSYRNISTDKRPTSQCSGSPKL